MGSNREQSHGHFRLAVYGKGGIGKSTMSANLSVAYAKQNKRLLQIGCDPKRDSTRLILGGRQVQTVLEYLRETKPNDQRIDDVLHQGQHGITCVEAGGPEPGVGCAGRGILSAFSLLDRLGCRWDDFDGVLYDVLGDVVCGGFAVPLRQDHASRVLIVTSEEFMSIYAANNILRGIKNMDQTVPKSVGLLINRRDNDADLGHLYRFAEAVDVPILGVMPRSPLFLQAEKQGRTVVDCFPAAPETAIIADLATQLTALAISNPRPLSDAQLEDLIRGRELRCEDTVQQISQLLNQSCTDNNCKSDACQQAMMTSKTNFKVKLKPGPKPELQRGLEPKQPDNALKPGAKYYSKSLLVKEPLHGCAFTGAVNTLTQIRDGITVAHSSRSCSHIAQTTMISSGLNSYRRHGHIIPEQLRPPLMSSDLNEDKMVHGGGESLLETLQQATEGRFGGQTPNALFVTTACPAAVIGDDTEQIVNDFAQSLQQSAEHSPDYCIPVIPITTDGNLEGDYLQGLINAAIETGRALINPDEPSDGVSVNIIGEKNIARNTDSNFDQVEGYLQALGLRVNTRFIRRCTVDGIRQLKRASLNISVCEDHMGRVLRQFLQDEFGCRFADNPLPVGWTATKEWLREIAAHFGRKTQAEVLIASLQEHYDQEVRNLRPLLQGRRVMIVSYNHDVDYILETALDLGMNIVKVGIVDYSQDNVHRTRYGPEIPVECQYNPDQRAEDIIALKPDLFLGNYQSSGLPLTTHYDAIPLFPNVGHLCGIELARRWMRIVHAPLQEGWRIDESRQCTSEGDITKELSHAQA